MRLVLLVTIALVGTAHADKKLQGYKSDFTKEVGGCQVQTRGISRVLTGATELLKTVAADGRAELERDVDELTSGLAQVKEYCDEVAGAIAFLDANAGATYRSVERELDARYSKIVKLRAASKKTIEDLQPTTRRLIPLIARGAQQPATEPRRAPARFPSGRSVELPSLPGTWRISGSSTSDIAEYSEAPAKRPPISASATTRLLAGGTCDQQHKALLARSDAEQLVDLDLPGAKQLGVAWGARYTRREQTTAHLVSVLCVPGKSGGLLATADVVPADQGALADELAKLMLRMIAAQKP